MDKRLIWDMPTRLFHWLLVSALIGQYITAEVASNALQWHFYIGYFTLGLVVFRVLWGFVGPTYARFTHFVKNPIHVWRYTRQMHKLHSPEHAGHNPMGGYAVLAMLVIIAVQAISGLFMSDDIFLQGPYYAAVSSEVQEAMNWLHHNIFNLLLGLVALHIAAVIFYTVGKKHGLIGAMMHGKKTTKSSAIGSSKLALAIVLALVSAAVVFYLVEIAPPEVSVEEAYY